ncbi:hypothetical protein KUTeg_013363, partial [Tegillarca granosa]
MSTKTRVITPPTSINRARSRISRSSKLGSASLLERVKSINADSEEEALFLTQFSRQSTCFDKDLLNESHNYSLSDEEKEPVDKRLEPQDVEQSVTYVDLTGNDIGAIGLKFLFDAFGDNSTVTYLNISSNSLRTEGAEIVTSFLVRQGVLESLCLSDNGFNDSDGVILSRIIKENKSLKKLVLSKNEFGEAAGIAFGKAIGINDRLDTLDLSCNHIRRKGAACIAAGIKENVGLKRIDLSFNGFGSEGMLTLAIAIKDNSTLTELDLSHNRIKDQDAEIFANQLGKNDTLKTLKLGDNLLTSKGSLKIIKAINAPNSASTLETLDLKTTAVSLDFIEEIQDLKIKKDINVIHGKIIEAYEPDDEGNRKQVIKSKKLPKTSKKPETDKKVIEKAKTDIDPKSIKTENIYQVEITHDINGNRADDVDVDHDDSFDKDDELEKEVEIIFGNKDQNYDGDIESESGNNEINNVSNDKNGINENVTDEKGNKSFALYVLNNEKSYLNISQQINKHFYSSQKLNL